VAAELDLDALVERLDVNAVAARLDMAQLTAGATQDVAVSGLDLVRRQLVRADATVESAADRVVRRKSGKRPDAPGMLEPEQAGAGEHAQSADETAEAAQLRRRDVSGHYAGPVTRLLALATDISLAIGTAGLLMGGLAYLLVTLFGVDIDLGSGQWLNRAGLAVCFLLWFSVPVALFGRTAMMAVAGLAVVGRDGGAPRPGSALIRALVLPFSVAFLGLGLIGIFVGRERRALHDVVAGTIVVYDWGARQAQQPVTIREQLTARVLRRQEGPPAEAPSTPL